MCSVVWCLTLSSVPVITLQLSYQFPHSLPAPDIAIIFAGAPETGHGSNLRIKKPIYMIFILQFSVSRRPPPQQCKQNSFGFEPEFWAGQWTNKIHFYYYLNIMLTRKHDCLFKDLIVPFMILKFRRPSLYMSHCIVLERTDIFYLRSWKLKVKGGRKSVRTIRSCKKFSSEPLLKCGKSRNNLITDRVSG